MKIVTVRSVISIAATKGWHFYQIDMYNAFLQGDLLDEVYMQFPKDFISQGENILVCSLVNSLMGWSKSVDSGMWSSQKHW